MLEINLLNLKKNVDTIRSHGRDLIGVVKNNAYGCGIVEVGKYLVEIGVNYLLVNDINEARKLIDNGITVPIIIFNSLNPNDYHYLEEYKNLVMSINSLDDCLNILNTISGNFKIQIHIDTMLNRSGIKDFDEFKELLKVIDNNPRIEVEGIFTHFASPNTVFEQLEKFKKFAEMRTFKMVHCCASSTYENVNYGNYVRCGFAMYDINQVMSLKTKPLSIRVVKKGESIGYEREYIANQDIKIAVLPIGYGNGFRLGLSGFSIYAKGNYYQVIGRICMNHIFVKVDDEVDVDTEFELISENNRASLAAKYLNTSTYEIYTNLKADKVKYIK